MVGFWFAPKRYGLGAVPSGPVGWAVTLAFLGLAIASQWLIRMLFADDLSDERSLAPLVTLAVEAVLLVGFIALARWKCSGPWRWRWGEE